MSTRTLPVKLTPAELATKSGELAANVIANLDLQDRAKAEAKGWKEKIDESGKVVKKLARVVRSESEDRLVTVHQRYDLGRRVIETWRLDTNEVVETRSMTAQEYLDISQGKLFDENPDDDGSGESDDAGTH